MPDTNVPTPETKRNDGGPVHAQDYQWPDDKAHLSGISLRDHIALECLKIILQGVVDGKIKADHGFIPSPEAFSKSAYDNADAMLAERSK